MWAGQLFIFLCIKLISPEALAWCLITVYEGVINFDTVREEQRQVMPVFYSSVLKAVVVCVVVFEILTVL